MRAFSPGIAGRVAGRRSGGYHLPSDASHHPMPWRSSLKVLLICPEQLNRA
jgi:hypothetical protein